MASQRGESQARISAIFSKTLLQQPHSNLSNVIQTDDTPLCAQGLEQARKLAARVRSEFHIVKVLTSDLVRAQQTATFIVESVGGLALTKLPMLRERSLGNVRGRVYDEVLAETGLDTMYDPSNETIEQTGEFESRVRSAWETLRKEAAKAASGESVAVVSHGMVLRFMLQNCVNAECGRDVKNASLTVLDPITLQVVDGIVNCTKHL